MEIIIALIIAHPIIALVLATAVILLLILLMFSKKSFELQLSENKSIKIGGSSKTIENKSLVKSCKGCRESVKNVTKERVKRVIAIREETLHRQMKVFENAMIRLQELLQTDYVDFLQVRKPHSVDIRSDLEYVVVCDKIELCMLKRVLSGINVMLIENHIAERTDDAWELYKIQQIRTIKSDIFRFIEQQFIPGYSVKREDQYKFFNDRWIFISSELDKCLNQARTLAIKCSHDVDEIKSKSDRAIFDLD